MPLNNIQKAAVFLKIIEPAVAMDVLKKIDAGTVSAISAEMAKLTAISEEDKQLVMSEYSMMTSISDSDSAEPEPEPAGGNAEAGSEKEPADIPSDMLIKTGLPQVADLIKDEHPMVIGILLSAFDPAISASILGALPADVQLDALRRIAGGQRAMPSVKEQVLRTLKRKLKEGEKKEVVVSGAGTMATADILSYFSASKSEELVNALKQHDEKLGADIQEHILTFDNIFLKIEDDKAIQKALRNIDRKDLAIALRKTNEATQQRVYKNMSAAAADMLKEDMQATGKQKVAAVEEAQRKIVAVLKTMARDGIVSFASAKKEEEELV